MIKRSFIAILMAFILVPLTANNSNYNPEFSTAGFFSIPNSGREVYAMNPAWRFYKGDLVNAEQVDFNDSEWSLISLPHGIEYLPTEASGGTNYQGIVWYRKHFSPKAELKGKKLFLHFEAIMGKSKIFVNGNLLAEHFGGYLPISVDITDKLVWDADNIIAVCADNSDDPSYPPGKAQDVLDFSYFGGIYRDSWLIAHNPIYITDPNYENEIAGGGLFVSYNNVAEKSADILLKTHIRNASKSKFSGSIEYELQEKGGKQVAFVKNSLTIRDGKATITKNKITLNQPHLWSPESPNLYDLIIRIKDNEGTVIDGYRRRIGVRSIEFKGTDGFWLNGKPYPNPLIGGNRHQDFAIVGNAVANSIHWRDAKKLRDTGMKVVRNAHCPQDPAFLDACDELGLFVINNTPGWQFWNEDPIFAKRVYNDIRNIVRRDRNHPSIWLWEPILNETWYPADFAKNALNTVSEEYPYPYSYSGCDSEARGHEVYPILFAHPSNGSKDFSAKNIDPKITYFTREWGDNVDDWSSHNSPSRVARNWGEHAMLVQANHYAKPDYMHTSYDALYRTTRQHVGGALWHSFDHQRGYHPDPFYGGLMDVFRQPKYSYYMFKAQRSPEKEDRLFETGPMVYIAHEMTPFSSKDVTVYSNCDEVRLTFNKGGKTWTHKRNKETEGLPSPIILFKDAYDFMVDKHAAMDGKPNDVFLLAEGIINGKVVATHEVRPARRPSKLLLWLDNEGTKLHADGSDFVTVVAAISDQNGNIKRLNNYYIRFSIEGEGRILGGKEILANPAPVKWGVAPILVQSTLKPGIIRITASVLFEGSQMPISGTLEFASEPSQHKLVYNESEAKLIPLTCDSQDSNWIPKSSEDLKNEQLLQDRNIQKLKEVELQQTEFGERSK